MSQNSPLMYPILILVNPMIAPMSIWNAKRNFADISLRSSIKLTSHTADQSNKISCNFSYEISRNNTVARVKYTHKNVPIAYGTGSRSYQYFFGLSIIHAQWKNRIPPCKIIQAKSPFITRMPIISKRICHNEFGSKKRCQKRFITIFVKDIFVQVQLVFFAYMFEILVF